MFFSKKSFLLGMIFGTVLLFSYLFTLPDGKLHIVFCDVGQGDAAYIRAPNNQDMLIDGGPNDRVLTCLGKNMPFYDRTLDVVALSHPQKDHLQGLISVLQRYKVNNFVIGAVGNDTLGYKMLLDLIRQKNIPVRRLYTGDEFSLGEVKISVFWPEKQWLASSLSPSLSDLAYLSDLSDLGNPPILGLQTTRRDLNDFSYYLHLSYGAFDALFTGDGDSRIQPQIMERVKLPEVEVLKFPHHGSKYGALPEFLDQVKPQLAVISAGKNPWGHPTEQAIKLLSNRAIKIKRTDREGDIEIISDGRNWTN